MSDNAIIAIVIGTVAVVVIVLLRGRIKKFGMKVFGQEITAETHDRPEPPKEGAHMTGVKAGGKATVRDETGRVGTMTDTEAAGDATVTSTGSSEARSPSKKAPPPKP